MSELLTVGGYGCIYKPSINCKGEETGNDSNVSKIQVDNESSRNEIHIASKLKSYSDFFILPLKYCKIKRDKIKKQDCDLIQKDENLMLIEMEYVPNRSFFDILTEDNLLERQIFVLLFNYSALLRAIYVLKKHNIIHFDLKLDNVLYDIVEQYPKILDFGISLDKKKISLSNLKKTFWIYAPWYYVWCPDIHFMCYLVNVSSNITLEVIEQIVKECVKSNEILALIDHVYQVEYEIAYVKRLSKYIGMDINHIAKDIIKHSTNWDIYSLGLIFIKLTKFVTTKNNIRHPFFSFFLDILKININPDTEKHLCEEDILKLLYEYVNNSKIKTNTKNKGFTLSYVKSIKEFHKEHWTVLKSRLMSVKN